MKLPRRKFLHLIAGAAALSVAHRGRANPSNATRALDRGISVPRQLSVSCFGMQ
jgi:hypothetical protein